jgi:hypothetical protein
MLRGSKIKKITAIALGALMALSIATSASASKEDKVKSNNGNHYGQIKNHHQKPTPTPTPTPTPVVHPLDLYTTADIHKLIFNILDQFGPFEVKFEKDYDDTSLYYGTVIVKQAKPINQIAINYIRDWLNTKYGYVVEVDNKDQTSVSFPLTKVPYSYNIYQRLEWDVYQLFKHEGVWAYIGHHRDNNSNITDISITIKGYTGDGTITNYQKENLLSLLRTHYGFDVTIDSIILGPGGPYQDYLIIDAIPLQAEQKIE